LRKSTSNLLSVLLTSTASRTRCARATCSSYYFGWNADYPDPENFFFLLDGHEAKVPHGGENAANYANPEFDASVRPDEEYGQHARAPGRSSASMNTILQHDAPWVFGLHPKSYTLSHRWLKNRKPNDVANNTLKYQDALLPVFYDLWHPQPFSRKPARLVSEFASFG
jgi:ABC-type oligopeptide transport system substrate-binding subunit